MEYMLMFNQTLDAINESDDPVKGPTYMAGWMAYMEAMQKAGVMKSGNRLQRAQFATTVRIRDGKRLVQDGPFADTKEQLGGYVIIEVPSLDEALEWAARSPSSSDGGTEVRPLRNPPPR